MRAFCLDTDGLAAQAFGGRGRRREGGKRREAGRRDIVGRGEIERRARLRIDADRGHERVALIVVQRPDQCIETARLNRACNLQLLANGARQIDVEAGERSVRQREMERRIIILGEEAQAAQTAEIRFGGVMMRVPKARHEHPLRGKERKGRQSDEGEQGEEAKLGLARRSPKSPAEARLTPEGKAVGSDWLVRKPYVILCAVGFFITT